MRLLGEAIDELQALEPDGLSDAELHELVVGLAREQARLGAAAARLLSVWEARRTWADDGSKSAAARLARDCAVAPASARRELRRARKLRSMPATAAALAEGKVSLDQADLVAAANQPELAELFSRDESLLLDAIRGLRYRPATRVVAYWVSQAQEAVGHAPASLSAEGRFFDAVRTIWDRVALAGSLDAVSGTEFLSELGRLEQREFEADWAQTRELHGRDATTDQLPRTAGQRRADALVEMARRSAAMPPGAQPPRPLITILAGYEAFARVCELADGTVIAPGQVVPLLAEADIERVVFDGPSRVLDVGVRQRFFTAATRRAVEVRDRHCQHPSGCDVPAEQCHIDHIVPYAQGGLTVQDNGRCYCPVHNRQRVGEPDERPPPLDDG